MTTGAIDEGYVKYSSDWRRGPAPDAAAVRLLDTWRRRLHAAGLIGHYSEPGIGYGNISIRAPRPGEFIISGTQTGHLTETGPEHYARVTAADIAGNRIVCVGLVQASSEALTHAAIYRLSERINAVVHVHSRRLWERERGRLPTTAADAPYGTPDMAREFERLWQESEFRSRGIAVMAGHDEGLVSIGATLAEASERMLGLAQEF
jgi:ribulose-5-phosphate 4-epimerase/fuculose-1-phosphate aldolase